ncbi:arsenate reductase family protein [Actinocorallia sp. A-T 12471]|uniref:arsenate reductase family protein n=1 Tax=Actinocorallia sp. A-T 12471 TaxID=3089813 RepID=UPI0029CC58E0|nr:arsenate reductase family protein [Actinocorallia sp. A-T 12471]MDX6743152.1 arsenate reductase family protein [Actinocorallia sp. A-T 12471]
MEIWHNPRCSKSRAALAALNESGAEFSERRYLDDAPTAAELEDVLTRLGLEPWDITRMGEPVAKELGLKSAERDRARWIEILATHPSLIQRPIILTDDGRAHVARDEASIEAALGR